MEDLKWPVDKCENCGFDLGEVTPRGHDKTGLSSDGLKKKMYTDYCPKCGRGYQVGYVDVPVPKEMTQEKIIQELPSPDQETQEPAEPVASPEPGAVRPPGKGEYFCTKCASNHKETSKIGKKHLKFKEA